MKKIGFICTKGLETFVDPLAAEIELQGKYKVRRYYVSSNTEVTAAVKWAEIVFLEWCNEVAIIATDMHDIKGKKVIVRLHSYEAFTDMPGRVDWNKVDYLVFVAPHIREIVKANVPGLIKNVCTKVIANGVDPNDHPIGTDPDPFSIAFVAGISYKKGPMLALQIIAKLVQSNPLYRLHIAGAFQDPRYQVYMTHLIAEMGLTDNVIFYGHLKDMTDFWKGKGFILSTSPHEGHPLNVVEGAMRGLRPVVHNSFGTKDLYPADWIFNTVDEAVEAIRSPELSDKWTPENTHQYATNTGWTRKAMVAQFSDLLRKLEKK